MRQFEALIATNETISPTWKALSFAWPPDLSIPEPGQFFTFRPSTLMSGDSSLLRRPLAFAAFKDNKAFALYQVRGNGTRALASLCTGSSIDLLGPLGTPFSLPEPDEAAILVGGGVGIGPMLYLHHCLQNAKIAGDIKLFLGFRSAAQIPVIPQASMAKALASAFLATDDGSVGFSGRVAEALEAQLATEGQRKRRFYACGPVPMLSAVASLAKREGNPAEVSVEQWMACGVGACYGCAVPSISGGFLRACVDGPVFDSQTLDWEALR
ncbi:MAG: dihydroorotate dehydrogenase electron transfer subunit [Spirochaetes bacterium]|nr:dihydroorotate dehydrogenase electron transfer subunit [Spirochaetota bacterium]